MPAGGGGPWVNNGKEHQNDESNACHTRITISPLPDWRLLKSSQVWIAHDGRKVTGEACQERPCKEHQVVQSQLQRISQSNNKAHSNQNTKDPRPNGRRRQSLRTRTDFWAWRTYVFPGPMDCFAHSKRILGLLQASFCIPKRM